MNGNRYSAEVAAAVAAEARQYLAAGAPVGQHLADQLLIPMAMAGGGSFRTLAPSGHTKTNVEVLRQFLDVEIRTEQLSPEVWQITLQGAAGDAGLGTGGSGPPPSKPPMA